MAVSADLERYRHIATLGRGGMATVFLAEDQLLGRKVALKRLSPMGSFSGASEAPNIQDISRLRREALLGASMSHANLVSIYDVVTTDAGDLVIVMEYVPGETLRDRMAREGRMSIDSALPILDGIAAGLDAVHACNIVHRDLKPANVLLGPEGVVKLADFGIAIAAEATRITSAGAVVGTFRYMAPEQLEDGQSAPAMDIYALAVVALEMLSGTKARTESNPVALAHAIATQPPPDLRAAWPTAPPAAAELLSHAMARDPSRRPRRATELVARLRTALIDEPTAHSPRPYEFSASTSTEKVKSTVSAHRRRRSLVPPILALVLASAVALLVIVLHSSSSRSTGTPTVTGGAPANTGPRHSPGRTSRSSSTTASRVTTSSTSAATDSTPSAAASSSGPAAGVPAGGVTAAGSGSSSPASSTATSPITATESFYHLAAAHHYPQAWALADPTLRRQLGGYASFEGGQAEDRSVTFTSARTLSQTSSAATIAVTTTSLHTNGTERCAGTVDLSQASTDSGWLLHLIHITCS